MSLDELEDAFRERQARSGARLVIVAMQIPEDGIRFLRPQLQRQGERLSEHVRKLIHQDVTWAT
jgi:hypothetical protein